MKKTILSIIITILIILPLLTINSYAYDNYNTFTPTECNLTFFASNYPSNIDEALDKISSVSGGFFQYKTDYSRYFVKPLLNNLIFDKPNSNIYRLYIDKLNIVCPVNLIPNQTYTITHAVHFYGARSYINAESVDVSVTGAPVENLNYSLIKKINNNTGQEYSYLTITFQTPYIAPNLNTSWYSEINVTYNFNVNTVGNSVYCDVDDFSIGRNNWNSNNTYLYNLQNALNTVSGKISTFIEQTTTTNSRIYIIIEQINTALDRFSTIIEQNTTSNNLLASLLGHIPDDLDKVVTNNKNFMDAALIKLGDIYQINSSILGHIPDDLNQVVIDNNVFMTAILNKFTAVIDNLTSEDSGVYMQLSSLRGEMLLYNTNLGGKLNDINENIINTNTLIPQNIITFSNKFTKFNNDFNSKINDLSDNILSVNNEINTSISNNFDKFINGFNGINSELLYVSEDNILFNNVNYFTEIINYQFNLKKGQYTIAWDYILNENERFNLVLNHKVNVCIDTENGPIWLTKIQTQDNENYTGTFYITFDVPQDVVAYDFMLVIPYNSSIKNYNEIPVNEFIAKKGAFLQTYYINNFRLYSGNAQPSFLKGIQMYLSDISNKISDFYEMSKNKTYEIFVNNEIVVNAQSVGTSLTENYSQLQDFLEFIRTLAPDVDINDVDMKDMINIINMKGD